MSTTREGGFWLALLVLAAFGVAPTLSSEASAQDTLRGKKLPDFALEAISGRTVSAKDLRGKFVVLDFWAVWCGPCQQSMPFFQRIQDDYGKYGLEVLGVHVDDRMPGAERIQEYLEDHGVQYDTLMSTVEVDDQFMIYAMPTTFLVGRDGEIKKVHVGFNPGTTPESLERDIRDLLDLD